MQVMARVRLPSLPGYRAVSNVDGRVQVSFAAIVMRSDRRGITAARHPLEVAGDGSRAARSTGGGQSVHQVLTKGQLTAGLAARFFHASALNQNILMVLSVVIIPGLVGGGALGIPDVVYGLTKSGARSFGVRSRFGQSWPCRRAR